MLRSALIAFACLASWTIPEAHAQQSLLRFDEVPFQPVDGLAVQGVEFGFTVDGQPSTEAFYHSFGPGALTLIDDPSLTGDSRGVLSLLFDRPTPNLSFAAALSTASPLSPGFTVELFDATNQSLGITPVATAASGALSFSEGAFSYTGTPVTRAVVDFADGPGSFAFDNLAYAIPEPSSGALATLAIVGVFSRRAARRWHAKSLLVSSRGDRTPIELFFASLDNWPATARRLTLSLRQGQ